MLRRTLVMAGLAVLLMVPAPARAAEAPQVLFILDGSGSMWGQVDGEPKIGLARQVLGNLIESLPGSVQVGLASYGHNRKDDCQDIEVVAPVGSDRAQLISAAEALNPKGKTPLTDAIRVAANEFKTHEGSASIVVVSDGKETCEGDPCAAARAAAGSGVDLKIHVVGFDVTDEEAQQLNCIADEGNGKYFGASNAEELVTAFAEVEKEVAAPAPPPQATGSDVLFEDHYARDEIGELYEVVIPDPNRMAVTDGKLLVVANQTPQGQPMPNNLVLLQKTFKGDFVATVRMDMPVTKDVAGGLYYFVDEKTYLFAGVGGWCCGDRRRPYFHKTLGDTTDSIDNGWGQLGSRSLAGYAQGAETWYLQMERRGVKYTARVSLDAKDWTDIGTHTVLPKGGRLGISAFGWSSYSTEEAAEFDDLIVRKPGSALANQ